MDEAPLEQCLIDACQPNTDILFDLPLDSRWRIFGNPLLTRSPQ